MVPEPTHKGTSKKKGENLSKETDESSGILKMTEKID
jgi:hypothetical protein